MSDTVAAENNQPIPSLWQLFATFATASLYGFGGVLPFAFRILVEERRYLTATQFNELFALSQFLPGPNVVNLSVVFGSRLRGPVGAAVCLFGLLGPPVAIITLIGFLYMRYGQIEALSRVLLGISAAAAGLICATVAKMAIPLFRPFSPRVFVALAGFAAIGLMRWPLPWVLLGLIPVSIAVAWWGQR
jgi:chromate transporter